jgi:pantoate--beta-alanine ligase
MEVVRLPAQIFSTTNSLRTRGATIGFVPTMGALHEGHFSLIKTALAENDQVVVSIFVNPIQFNKEEDLVNYPRTIEEDIKALTNLGVKMLYLPDAKDMYPTKPSVYPDFGSLGARLEGAFRPGHFNGVGLVVSKLFHQVNPTKAYFGLKDLQQYLLVKKMVENFSFPVDVIGLPTLREKSGLAMSSRNRRLSPKGLIIASKIYLGLERALDQWHKQKSLTEVISELREFYQAQDGLELEYAEMVDPQTLNPITTFGIEDVALCIAAYVEGVRLIDNIYLRQD